MKTSNKKNQWLPILLIVWNLIDIAVHISVDMVELLRVSGNISPGFGGRVYFPAVDGKIYEISVYSD